MNGRASTKVDLCRSSFWVQISLPDFRSLRRGAMALAQMLVWLPDICDLPAQN